MNRAVNTADAILTGLVLWVHFDSSAVPWPLGRIEIGVSEEIRRWTDLLAIGILCFHLIDIILGKKLWTTTYSNKRLNFILLGLFVAFALPYIRIWFLHFYYFSFVTDILRVISYCGLILIWIIAILKRAPTGAH